MTPASPVLPGKSADFLVTYNPTVASTANTTITIDNNDTDADENAYSFAVSATAADGIENALDMDGTDDFVKTRAYISGSYTKEAWVYFKGADQLNNIVSGNSTTANTAFWIPNENGLKLAAGHNAKWYQVEDTVAFPVNQWVHVAVTFDVSKKNDGSLQKMVWRYQENTSIRGNAYEADGDSLLIGAYNDQFFFNGMIDEVSVWNYARTGEEINTTISQETEW